MVDKVILYITITNGGGVISSVVVVFQVDGRSLGSGTGRAASSLLSSVELQLFP